MKKRIVLISCVSKKLLHRAKARDLYVSNLFKLNLKYATSIQPDEVYVLSAKHGLVNLEQEIEPFDLSLNDMRDGDLQDWADRVLQQLKEITSVEDTEFTFLAGDKYRKYLLPHLKDTVIPLKGLRIGKQLQLLKELTA